MASPRQKTTVYLETEAYRRLKFVAREGGVAPAELIREAIDEFIARRTRRRLPRSLGAGRTSQGTLSERAEELLGGFGKA
jgi:predicted transcriptional regulator